MKPFLFAVLALLLPATAHAQAVRWTRFDDPVDNAFTVDVPAGWNVIGGITHRSRTDFSWYVTAVSPDGMVTVRIGDPQIGFISSTPVAPPPVALGKAKKPDDSITAARPYETGADFALRYAKLMGSQLRLCDKPKTISSQEEANPPGFLDQIGTRTTTGDAFILCIDRAYVGYVIATTVAVAPDRWNVPWLAAFDAPVDRRAETAGVLQHIATSWSFSPAWIDKQRAGDGLLPNQLAALNASSSGGERAQWESQIDAHARTALLKIDSVMHDAQSLCEADTKMPMPHQCGSTGHVPGR